MKVQVTAPGPVRLIVMLINFRQKTCTMFKTIIVWSEVWGLLIPLAIFLLSKIKKPGLKPVIIYVIIALLLNCIGRGISLMNKAEMAHKLPYFLQKNHLIYNLNSIFRVLLFGWLIIESDLLKKHSFLKYLLPVYILFVIVNFWQWENILSIGTILNAVESTLLLGLCIYFFLQVIKDDSEKKWVEEPVFLVCIGVSLYETVNFFIFLFFHVIAVKDQNFGVFTMKIFSITFIILCILLALALSKNNRSGEKINAVP